MSALDKSTRAGCPVMGSPRLSALVLELLVRSTMMPGAMARAAAPHKGAA